MNANPFIDLYEVPVAALTDAAYACLLLAALVATWWALGRNLLYLRDRWQEGWLVLVPFWYTARAIALLCLVAIDLLLIAGIIHVVS